ncbi:MAG: hypothetical protein JSW73_03295 [Candidatus Woesearchaeota archaeon]|nr:MAG: hypothetical protein JSW73_03295 [Candidatus Woesearchaeota archaeon]
MSISNPWYSVFITKRVIREESKGLIFKVPEVVAVYDPPIKIEVNHHPPDMYSDIIISRTYTNAKDYNPISDFSIYRPLADAVISANNKEN